MNIVDNESIKKLVKVYKKCREVEKDECPFSRNCGTCMYSVFSQDSDIDYICTRIRKGDAI